MKNHLAGLAIVSIALAMPLAAHALTAHIEGRVDFGYSRDSPSGDVSLNDELAFDENLAPNALSSFAIAAETSDAVGAAVGARVGNGWMRFQNTAVSSIFATPGGTEAGGGARFLISATVHDTLTIDAPGLTGMTGSANLGFRVDGVLAAAVDASHPRSEGRADGLAIVAANLVANTTAFGALRADVGNPAWMGLPPVLGFSEEFLGGVVHFTYGTPIDVFVSFYSEGRASAQSNDESDAVGGLPATATLVSDFGNTITWAGVAELSDADGNAVADFTAYSGSGADLRFAITAPPVPEPATVLLWTAGLVLLALGIRRRPRPGVARRIEPGGNLARASIMGAKNTAPLDAALPSAVVAGRDGLVWRRPARTLRLLQWLLLAAVAMPVVAAPVTWVGATADWFSAGQWNPAAVPTSADDASVDNGGTAQASSAAPVARSLSVGAGAAGAPQGSVTVNGFDLGLVTTLHIGRATQAGVLAQGSLAASGHVRGPDAGTGFQSFAIGVAFGNDAGAVGTATVGGDLNASFASIVGGTGTGSGINAGGSLNVMGTLAGLSQVGVAINSTVASTANGSVTAGNLRLAPNSPFSAGVVLGGDQSAMANGSVVVSGALQTGASPGAWLIGSAAGGTANGFVQARSVDTSAGSVGGLQIGVANLGGVADGRLQLAAGTLGVSGTKVVGSANADSGSVSKGVLQLGGALQQENSDGNLDVGRVSGTSLFGQGRGTAAGHIETTGIADTRFVTIGSAAVYQGLETNGVRDVQASGTAVVGSGGIVNDAFAAGQLRVGIARAVPVNGAAVGPGAEVTGNTTVGGDILGYQGVTIGQVEGSGKADGRLQLSSGTLSTQSLLIGNITGAGGTITNGAADASGRLTVNDGAVVLASSNPGALGLAVVGSLQFPNGGQTNLARGEVELVRSTWTGGVLNLAQSGAQGTMTAREGSVIDVNSLTAGFGAGQAEITLDQSTLKVSRAGGNFGNLGLGASGASALLKATKGSSIEVEGFVAVLPNAPLNTPTLARMELEDSSLKVGGGLSIGDFAPDSRAEVQLRRSTGEVGGDARVGRSANIGALFGEALLALDASLLEIGGALSMDLGGELLFGVQGLVRGLEGYGAIDAATAELAGDLTMDFAGLVLSMLPLSDSYDFDVLVTDAKGGITGNFLGVSMVNLPTGYVATWGVVGEAFDIYRVTLNAAQVPEPATLGLVLVSLTVLGAAGRRKGRRGSRAPR